MLGWHVSVFRKSDNRLVPAVSDDDRGQLLAQWQGSLGATGWLSEASLTADGRNLGGNGYPSLFSIRCSVVRPVLLSGPPFAREVWIHDPGDIIDWNVWKGKTFIDEDALAEVTDDEWLLIVAWDES